MVTDDSDDWLPLANAATLLGPVLLPAAPCYRYRSSTPLGSVSWNSKQYEQWWRRGDSLNC